MTTDASPAKDSPALYLNGLDGETGEPLIEPLTLAEATALALPAKDDPLLSSMKERIYKLTSGEIRGLPADVDSYKVEQAGWAVVFAEDTPDDVREALQPLIDHRKSHVPADRCKVLTYKQGQSYLDWIEAHDISVGDVDPERIPYYLLLAGGPASIPFDVQTMLDIDYAVGRLSFDTAAEYARYVQSLIDHEKPGAAVPTQREIHYFGPRYDIATGLSSDHLIDPLYSGLPGKSPVATDRAFTQRCFAGGAATKATLADILHGRGPARPAMLFTASHGAAFRLDNPKQPTDQGAIVCQDAATTKGPARYLAAADVADDAKVHGLIAFFFACHGAGTPLNDEYLADRTKIQQIAPAPFVSSLPRRLLSHPGGGALAVIGHIERAWGYSIKPARVDRQLLPFRNVISHILMGRPVGVATQDFSDRYAAMSTYLLGQSGPNKAGKPLDTMELVQRWIQRNDAGGYVLLGDPAARLRVEDMK